MSNKKTNQDPIFEGSFKDFKIFLGDYVKNSVPELTRKYKKIIGSCEYDICNKTNLEAAHKKTRSDIIKKAFNDAKKDDKIYLKTFNILNKIYHTDPEEFHFLCNEHHNAFDGKGGGGGVFKKSKIKRIAELSKYATEAYIVVLLETLYEGWSSEGNKNKINYLKDNEIINIEKEEELIEKLNKYFKNQTNENNKFNQTTKQFKNLKNNIIINLLKETYIKKRINTFLKELYEGWNSNEDKTKYLKDNEIINIKKEEELIKKLNEYFKNENKFTPSKMLNDLKKEAKNQYDELINSLHKKICEDLNEKQYKKIKKTLKNNLLNHYKKS